MMRLSKAILEKTTIGGLHKKKKIVLLIFLIWTMVGLINNAYAQAQAKHYQTRPEPHFKPNKGQVADYEGNQVSEFEYVYQAPGMKMGLKKNGFSYNLYTVEEEPKADKKISEAIGKPVNANQQPERPGDKEKETTYHYHRVEVAFKGANENPEIIAGKQMDYYANYHLGCLPEPVTNVHGYRKLTYENLYDNIDLVLSTKTTENGQPKLKYDIVVHPGGDLSEVKMAYKGMEGLSNKNGNLQIATSQGKMTETIPESYWAENEAKAEVNYHVEGNMVSFQAQGEQKGQTLVVDPTLDWSTYHGGSAKDRASDLTTDGTGHVYVTGDAESNFPTTKGAYQKTHKGRLDATISKFTVNGQLNWSTYLGGDNNDFGRSLTTSPSGYVYITGHTRSSNFPTSSGVFQPSYGGGEGTIEGDAFLCKFTAKGILRWCTFLGGAEDDRSHGIATGESGNIYITGDTDSRDFPTSTQAYQDSNFGYRDAFISSFSSSGNLRWSTYMGGEEIDGSSAITYDKGFLYITGGTKSPNFPVTNKAFQDFFAGAGNLYGEAFVSKFTKDGSLIWSTFLGGSDGDKGKDIITDGRDHVYVTGITESNTASILDSLPFPITRDPYQNSNNDKCTGGGFLIKFTKKGDLSWSTCLCLKSYGVTKSNQGYLYVTGESKGSCPVTKGPIQDTFGGWDDVFLSQLTNSGHLTWSTYLGGGSADRGRQVATDDSGNVHVVGWADAGFPTTSGAYQDSFGGGSWDAFISKLNLPQKPHAGFVSDSGCAGDTLRFVDTSSIQGNDTITRYDWYFGDGDSASGKSVNHVYDTAGNYTVELIVTTNKGGRDVATQPVTVNPVPQAAFEGNTNLCVGDTLSFINNTQFGGPPDSLTHTWSLGNEDTLRTREPEYTYDKAGEYTVGLTVTSEKGCSSSESMPLQVGDTVSSAFTFEKLNNKTVSFDAASEDGQRYNWDFGDGVQSDSINPTHPYDSSRKYQVTLTVFSSDGCPTTSNDSVDLGFVGIDQNASSKEINFSAYPNPFEQAVKVEYTLAEASAIRLEVFTADGRRVAAPLQTTQQPPGEYTYQLNLKDAKVSAVYFLRLTIDENVYLKRIFKAK